MILIVFLITGVVYVRYVMNNIREGSTMVNPRNTGVPATHLLVVSKVVLSQKEELSR